LIRVVGEARMGGRLLALLLGPS